MGMFTEGFEEEQEKTAAWKAQAVAYGKLLVCYRLGKRPSEKLLDELHKASLNLQVLGLLTE